MDLHAPHGFNALACTICKSRKVKCDKIEPRCGRCTKQDVECVYPTRQKKKLSKTSKERNAEINALFDRLQRVEKSVLSHNAQQALAATRSRFNPHSQASPQVPTPASTTDVTSRREDESASPWLDGSDFHESDNIHAVLEEAVDRIQKSKLRSTFHAVKSTQSITIPIELAKKWVTSYFISMPLNMTSTLEDNRKLLEMMPDLIDQLHVHIEPAIVVIYYVILYHGCCLPDPGTMGLPDPESYSYLQQAYILTLRMLPAWQRSATGSLLDLNAAIMMVRAAVECHDIDLAYKMHKLACEYAEGLRLHRLDDGTDACSRSIARTDSERRRFWDLVQYDIYFRLMLHKPFAFQVPMGEWKVNLPYLATGLEPGPNPEPAIMFLFCSRVTFEIATFFKHFDALDGSDKRSLLPEVQKICQNLQALYEEYQIDNVLRETQITQVNGWVIADAAISGLMSIVLMLRMIDVTDTPLILEPSRHVLQIVDSMLHQVPTLGIMALSFFCLMAFMPYASLADHVLRSSEIDSELRDDIVILERLKDMVGAICKDETDFVPLLRAMQHTCVEIRSRIPLE